MQSVQSDTSVAPIARGKPQIQGWCPGALRPMLAGDGLVVRIRPRGGRLSQAQAAGIATLADQFGNGVIDLTTRANVQLRGVTQGSHPHLIDGLRSLGLIDESPEAEARRNVVVAPFWSDGDDTQTLATALANALSIPGGPLLPEKFGFAVDCGAHPVLQDTSADIRIERSPSGLAVRADGFAIGACVALHDAVPAAMELAHWFIAATAHRPVPGRMAALAPHQPLPARFQTPLLQPTASYTPALGASSHGWMVGFEFGQLRAETLAELSQLGALRLTPWRMVLIEGATDTPNLAGLITQANDPLLRVVACTGAPACLQAQIATRPLARAIAPYVPANDVLHVSGCAKGCAHQKNALTLVGTPDGIDLVRHGRASSTADFFALTMEAVVSHFAPTPHASPV